MNEQDERGALPERLMEWRGGAGLLWDVYAFGKWSKRIVSPIEWDARTVYLDMVRAGYAEHIELRLVSASNNASPDDRASFEAAWSESYGGAGEFLLRHHTLTDQYANHDTQRGWEGWNLARAASTSANVAQGAQDMADAYVGAREDLAIWKKRALEAEALNRKFIAEINGPTHMGEPVIAAPIYAYEWDCGPGVVHRDFQYRSYNGRYPDRTLTLYAAPPAQTALTDDARDALIERLKRRYGNEYTVRKNYGETVTHHVGFDKHPLVGEAVAALTAAQSASGDTK